MRIGVPREIKPGEGRVALTPGLCRMLSGAGHTVQVETEAGRLAGYTDDDYRTAGAQVVPDAAAAWDCDLLVKVKDPIAREWPLLRAGQVVFCFLHLAANPQLEAALCRAGVTAIAFETVTDGPRLPILAPMSEVAGRVAVVQAAALLTRPGGSGVVLGGVTGAGRGHVVVVGAGQAGNAAAGTAAALGAQVTAFDRAPAALTAVRALGPNVTGLSAEPAALAAAIAQADLVVGAVLLPGAAAPRVITRAMVAAMRPGSVLADIAVDQGGCAETTRPTTQTDPVYVEAGVIHYAVTNIPGGAPRSSTPALAAVLGPYVQAIADGRWRTHPGLRAGLAVEGGVRVVAA